jgi:hypothetical protein
VPPPPGRRPSRARPKPRQRVHARFVSVEGLVAHGLVSSSRSAPSARSKPLFGSDEVKLPLSAKRPCGVHHSPPRGRRRRSQQVRRRTSLSVGRYSRIERGAGGGLRNTRLVPIGAFSWKSVMCVTDIPLSTPQPRHHPTAAQQREEP